MRSLQAMNMLRCESVSPIKHTAYEPLAWFSYEDLVKNHKVTYVAGGAAQNAARCAAVCFYMILPSIDRRIEPHCLG